MLPCVTHHPFLSDAISRVAAWSLGKTFYNAKRISFSSELPEAKNIEKILSKRLIGRNFAELRILRHKFRKMRLTSATVWYKIVYTIPPRVAQEENHGQKR